MIEQQNSKVLIITLMNVVELSIERIKRNNGQKTHLKEL